jgi:hypothetical protein
VLNAPETDENFQIEKRCQQNFMLPGEKQRSSLLAAKRATRATPQVARVGEVSVAAQFLHPTSDPEPLAKLIESEAKRLRSLN